MVPCSSMQLSSSFLTIRLTKSQEEPVSCNLLSLGYQVIFAPAIVHCQALSTIEMLLVSGKVMGYLASNQTSHAFSCHNKKSKSGRPAASSQQAATSLSLLLLSSLKFSRLFPDFPLSVSFRFRPPAAAAAVSLSDTVCGSDRFASKVAIGQS